MVFWVTSLYEWFILNFRSRDSSVSAVTRLSLCNMHDKRDFACHKSKQAVNNTPAHGTEYNVQILNVAYTKQRVRGGKRGPCERRRLRCAACTDVQFSHTHIVAIGRIAICHQHFVLHVRND